MLFFKAKPDQIAFIKWNLQYETLSGQKVNYTKSSLFFSKSIDEDVRHQFAELLSVPQGCENGKYLDLPFLIGRSKKAIFGYIKDRIWRKISG